jgi:hypothetical protein
MTNSEQNILAKTRAEEHDADVWGEFYIPPYFNRLSFITATKSTYIVGKRGCGKTMLLKYLDYHTAFSEKRTEISNNEVSHIGIYWRVDTQFCNSLNHRGISEHEWITIFESYFALVISVEIIRSLRVIATSACQVFTMNSFKMLELNSVVDFHPDFPIEPEKLELFLESIRRKFASWISNISSTEKPILPPGKFFLEALINDIKQSTGMNSAAVFVYVDEVENLVPYQRRVLNTFLKHSQRPLIVSFTSKELSNETATTGTESINATHDFRLLQLDELLTDNERKVFFAEVFLANLDLAKQNYDSPLLTGLRDPNKLKLRTTEAYQKGIFLAIRSLFPSKIFKEIAVDAINEPRIFNILKERISKALTLHKTKLNLESFLEYKHVPEALFIVPALLNRPKHNAEDILSHLINYSKSIDNSFTDKEWIHNNLVGALLELYRPYGGICPIYSGFDTFFTMANSNLRQFLILCYKALEVADLADENQNEISLAVQARAAYEASDQLIREIKTFGTQGERLRTFVLRLGSVFRTLQSSPAMSEPEQNQFTINSGSRVPNAEETDFIAEAKKYGIITEQLETKTKGQIGSDIVDYQLNPIYSPYFQISYRRIRKINLSVEEFHILALGTEDEYKDLSSRLFKHQDKLKVQAELWK